MTLRIALSSVIEGDSSGTTCARLCAVLGDLALKIGEVLARQQADLAERREMFLHVYEIANHEIGLANVFVRAAMAGFSSSARL